ncbi:MAG: bifunctional alpha/beta hydrolase/class I SAM-dependent methyltransferase [Acidobacteriota bacterium]
MTTNTETGTQTESMPTRLTEEHTFVTADGVRLFFRYWPPRYARMGAVLLLHRGHEHSGRVAHMVDELNLPDYAFFALDARAHGRSGGEQGPDTTMSTFVQDLDDFVRSLRATFGVVEEELALVAQSIGAVIAAAWVHDYAPNLGSLVLASPAFRVKLYVPFARMGLALGHSLFGNFFVKSQVTGSALTRDPERAASYATDPLIKRPISVNVLLSLDQMSQRLVDDAGAIRVPVQMLISGSDWVVRQQPQRDFFDRLGTEDREWHVFEGFRHDTLGERDRHLPIAKVRMFLERQFAAKTDRRTDLLGGNPFTQQQYEALQQPLPWWSLPGLSFSGQKLFMRTLGRWAGGMRLGQETGFDSGASLDYVYRNQPSGFTPLGRLFDYFYLNAIGWRGIRVRRQMLEALLSQGMNSLRQQGRAVRILDVAAGHGRYVLECVKRSEVPVKSVLLRDINAENVAAGTAVIVKYGLANSRFEQGDAFDADALASIFPKASVSIVSGLYELFPSNGAVRESLRGIAAATEPGGFLLYTGQPWHPQLEMIARTLTSHRGGAPWIMRRRTQEELDQLVASAGFRKVAQRVDPTGLFTVSLAERL